MKSLNFDFDPIQESIGSFGSYQRRLLLITQLGYISITGSFLCSLFDFNNDRCFDLTPELSNGTNDTLLAPPDLDLGQQLGFSCHDYRQTCIATSTMIGGVIGSAFFGYLSDSHGRRFVCVVTLVGVTICNALIANLPVDYQYIWILFDLVFVLIGAFCGGYLVVNVIYLMEIVGNQWRMLCSALNGWPIGMIVMALSGFLCRNSSWRVYHVVLAIQSFFIVTGFISLYESPRWLISKGTKPYFDKAKRVIYLIARANNRRTSNVESILESASDKFDMDPDQLVKANRRWSFTVFVSGHRLTQIITSTQLRTPFLALCFSWLSSSLTSFGVYFSLHHLTGDKYLNLFVLGILKFGTGLTPLFLTRCLGHRTILFVFIIIACTTIWIAAISVLAHTQFSLLGTILSLLGAAAIDPIWKINHLLSAELFPTVLRGTARASCNVASRMGSIVAPQIQYLAVFQPALPFIVYGSFLFGQLVMSCLFLPETKNKSLHDFIEDDIELVENELESDSDSPLNTDQC